MEKRNPIKALFGSIKSRATTYWREINGYTASFSPYNGDLYANETCRACIRKLAEETSKANATVTNPDKRLETLLNLRPNMYMNGKDFLYKCRTLYEIHNTLFVYINRDDKGNCISLYPIPNCPAEAVDYNGELFIKFYLANGDILPAAWADLAVVRKDYNSSDIFGDSNNAISASLELLNTANQGISNAIKSTANLRGILKNTKGSLSDEDKTKLRDNFVADYLSMTNTSGVAVTDSYLEYTPLYLKPLIADSKSVEELRNNIYRYYGMNEGAITNSLTGDAAEALYEGAIEPFLIAFSLELTYKIYSERQRGHGNEIKYESKRMQFMTMKDKLALVQMMDRESLLINEWRDVLNLAPLPDGNRTTSWQNPKKEGVITDVPATDTLSESDKNKVVEAAEDTAGKTLNGAQTQSLISVVSQYAAGALTLGQAVNIIAISIGITKSEAKNLLEGAVD